MAINLYTSSEVKVIGQINDSYPMWMGILVNSAGAKLLKLEIDKESYDLSKEKEIDISKEEKLIRFIIGS